MHNVRAISAAAIAAAQALVSSGWAHAEAPAPRPSVHAIPAAIPTLRGAVALGTLVAIGPGAREAEFRIGCGWYVAPRRRVKLGLWKVSLRGVGFNLESYGKNGPGSGVAHSVGLRTWESYVLQHGWSGALWLTSDSQPYITNTPTTDICAGQLG
jgi:hypothetical protein